MTTDTTTHDNKRVVRDFVERVLKNLDGAAVDELVADDLHSHTWPSNGDEREALKRTTLRMRSALSDINFTIEDLIAEGDRVAVRLVATARQSGEFMGLPPSNRTYEVGEIHIFRLRDGRIIEHWHQYDAMGLMKQLQDG